MPKEAKERLQERLCKKKAEEEERQKTDEAKRRAEEFKTHRGEVDENTLKSIFLSVILYKHNKNKNYQIALGCFIHALSLISESNEGGEGIFPNRVKDQIKFISSLEGKTLEQGNNKFQLPQNILEILDTVIVDIKEKEEDLGSNLKLLMSEEDQKEIKYGDNQGTTTSDIKAKGSKKRRGKKGKVLSTPTEESPDEALDATTDDLRPLSKMPERALDELKDIIWGIENTFIEAFQTITPSDKLKHPSICRSRSSPELSK